MPNQHFVVDGSNLATEGRTTPSLEQLQEAVRAFRNEYGEGTITVVVDASFTHRIDESERPAYERAEAKGEIVSPPAGALGRGDGFLLQIADRTHATVLSNDSFQEFHGEYPWLFEVGRLIGGKPVPGVGWIFSLRTPVRGAKSRRATRPKEAVGTESRPKRPKAVTEAIAAATADALRPGKRRRARRKGPPPEAVNDPAPFLQFLIDHRLGREVEGVVEEFASHGAFVAADGVRAYVPLAAMGDPPPTRARDVLEKGETRAFVVQAVDAPRRAIELGLPGFSHPAGTPSDETVAAVSRPKARPRKAPARSATATKTPAKKHDSRTARKPAAKAEVAKAEVAKRVPAKKSRAKKSRAKKSSQPERTRDAGKTGGPAKPRPKKPGAKKPGGAKEPGAERSRSR